jgi:cyclase
MSARFPLPPDRRTFLTGLLAGTAASLLPLGFTSSVRAATSSLNVVPVDTTLRLITGAGGNVLVAETAEGLLLVDGGNVANTPELLKVLGKARPVRVLINTHWHPDQTGSNEVLAKAGARIIAHANTKLWLSTEIDVQWQKKVYPPRPAIALPTEILYTQAKLDFGGTKLEYGHLPQAHTDGDLYVFLPERNVLFTGDIMNVGAYPILDWSTGGWIGGMASAARRLASLADANTKVVPGLGPVQTKADLQVQADMLTALHGRLVGLLKKGMSVTDMIAAKPTAEFDAKWGDPALLIRNAYPGLWAHVREHGGIL